MANDFLDDDVTLDPTESTKSNVITVLQDRLKSSNIVVNAANSSMDGLIEAIQTMLETPIDMSAVDAVFAENTSDAGEGDDSLGIAKPTPTPDEIKTSIQDEDAKLIARDIPPLEIGNEFDITDYPDSRDTAFNAPTRPSFSQPSAPRISAPPTFTERPMPDNFTFTPESYVSGLLAFIQGKIEEAIGAESELREVATTSNVDLHGNTLGVALVDNTIEQATYDRAVSRMMDEEAKQIADVEDEIQSRGFSLPPGLLSAKIAKVRTSALKAREDLNNDVIKARLELEQKRTEYELQKANQITDAQFKHDTIVAQLHGVNVEYLKAAAANKALYIESATRLETLLADIHKMEQQMKFDSEKFSLESALSIYNTKVELYKGQMQAYQIESDVSLASTRAELEYNRSLIDVYTQDIAAERGILEARGIDVEIEKAWYEKEGAIVGANAARIKAQNDRALAISSLYESEVRAHGDRLKILSSIEMLDYERYRIESAGKVEEVRAMTTKATAKIDAAMKRYAIDMELLKQQVQVQGSIVSSALNAVNSGASLSTGATYGSSSSSTRTRSANHSYQYSGSIAAATKAEEPGILP